MPACTGFVSAIFEIRIWTFSCLEGRGRHLLITFHSDVRFQFMYTMPFVLPARAIFLARQGQKIFCRPKIGPLGAAFPPPRGVFLGQAPGAKAAFF